MKTAKIPGLSVTTFRKGSNFESFYYGVLNTDSKTPVTYQSVFQGASLSKPLFAFLVLKFVEKGLLQLDEPLSKYLGSSGVMSGERGGKITARMVLSHTSGLPNSGSPSVDFEPGTKFKYSGIGYQYLQEVIETIAKKSLEEIAREEVFVPLGMTRSSFVWQESYETTSAFPHDENGSPGNKLKFEKPMARASLYTTTEDYAKFIAALWRDTQTRTMMFESVIELKDADLFKMSESLSGKILWGLGVGLDFTSSTTGAWHWGHNTGMRSYFYMDTKSGSGFVYLSNSANGLSILREISKKFQTEVPSSVVFLEIEYPPISQKVIP